MGGMARLLHDPAFYRLGLTLFHFLWQGTALASLAWATRLLLRRARPAVRYAIFLGLLVLMAAAPVVTFTRWAKPPAPAIMTRPEMDRLLAAAARQQGARFARPGAEANTRRVVSPSVATSPPTRDSRLLAARHWLRRAWGQLRPRLPAAGLLWMLGVVLLSGQLLVQWGLFLRVVRRAARVGGEWPHRLASLSTRLGVRRAVRLLQSVEARTPVTAGWLRPVVLLPPALLLGLTPEQLEAVLAHELAHIRRHDFAVSVFQRIVEVLLFYHPAVWWVSGLIRTERELCCDDLVVATGGSATAYARVLTELEALRLRPPRAALAVARGPVMARARRLLLAVEADRRPMSWSTLVFPALALAVIALISSIAPLGGQPYVTGTLTYQESSTQLNSLYWELGGETARVISGRAAWKVEHPSPFHIMEYSPQGDEVLFLRPTQCPWKGAATADDHPSVVWKAKLDARGRPDFSHAVDLVARAGLGRGDSGMAKWSPDGRRVTFLHIPCGCEQPNAEPWAMERQLWVVNADGTGAQQIRIPGRVYAHGSARWMPDGSRILLNAVTPLPGHVGCGCGTFLVDAAGEHPRQLPALRSAAVSPDGRWIAGMANDPLLGNLMALTWKRQRRPGAETYRWRLVLMRPDGTGVRTILARSYRTADLPGEAWSAATALSPHDLTWSPDGRQVAFLSAMNWDPKGPPINRQIELYLCDLPSGRLTQMTHDNLEQCTPVWME